MLKKFFALTILFLMTSASCLAMTFQNPAEIGSVSAGGGDKLKIDGATEIHATPASRPNTYIKGVATFGEIYLYFDCAALSDKVKFANTSADMLKIYNETSFFGSSDAKNTVPHFVYEGLTKIYRIANDGGIKLYLLATETGGGGSMEVIGTNYDGTWVKYFNTRDGKKIFGLGYDFYFNSFRVAGDTIIFRYAQDNNVRELCYKWNSSTQRFDVSIS